MYGHRGASAAAPLRRPPPRAAAGDPTAAECAASACVLCVCCPLALLWCCVRLPYRTAAAISRRLRRCAGCRGRGSRVLEASSSFSDHELEWRSGRSCGGGKGP